MAHPRLLIFDDGVGIFGPMTDRRAAFSLRTGKRNNRIRIECSLGIMASDLQVADQLAPIYRATETDARVNAPLKRDTPIAFHVHDGEPSEWRPVTVPGDASVLMVNGRWTGVAHAAAVRALAVGHAIVQADGQVVAVHLDVDEAEAFAACGFAEPTDHVAVTIFDKPVLLQRPWHILDQLEATLAHDLAAIHDRIASTATVHPSAVLDDSGGPIVIADHAAIGALSVIEGPCYIGPHSTISPRAHIRRHSVIGPRCKVGGEVSYSIIEGNSNKAHEGFLGHSLVGEWVNLGAATNVSNLKNTYGEVAVQLSKKTEPQETGRTFLGPVIGDFVRTAIGTRLTTGSVIGTGAMLALSIFAPKYVERFSFLTDKGSMPTDINKLLSTARIMMSRRQMQLPPEEEILLRALARV